MKKPLLLAVTCCLLLISTPRVQACDCASKEPEVLFEESGMIFSGTVIDIDILDDPSRPAINTFEVSKVWKGDEYKTIQVYSTENFCESTSFELGKEYLVYTYAAEDILSPVFCAPTQVITNAQEEIQALNSLMWKGSILKIMVGVLGTLGLLLAFRVFIQRKRKNKR